MGENTCGRLLQNDFLYLPFIEWSYIAFWSKHCFSLIEYRSHFIYGGAEIQRNSGVHSRPCKSTSVLWVPEVCILTTCSGKHLCTLKFENYSLNREETSIYDWCCLSSSRFSTPAQIKRTQIPLPLWGEGERIDIEGCHLLKWDGWEDGKTKTAAVNDSASTRVG